MDAYDQVPYDCQPIPCTAPEQLALSSQLHGGPAPRVRGARVLEIGCGDGANLLSLAYHRPDSSFVGVDSSGVQIEDARRSALRLGLSNTTLHAADVTELAGELGAFDYVLVHGMMSWVSDAVRDGVFALCRESLAPNGLLYLSYNTNPGWLARGTVRDVVRRTASTRPRERVSEARSRGDAVRQVLEQIGHPYAQLMTSELSRLHQVGESYLLHEYLSAHNRPYWFREFASLAAGFGFDYLAEAAFTQPEYRVPTEISECAASLASDPLEIEGLIDVLWFRQHRASLFCRRSRAPREPLALDRLTVASGLRSGSEAVALDPDVTEAFTGYFEPDVTIETADSATKAALAELSTRWPRGLPLEQLFERVRAVLGEGWGGQPELWGCLRDLHGRGQVELRLVALPPVTPSSEAPAASPLTRWEAERRPVVTTPSHQRLPLSSLDRLLIPRLDGHASREALIEAVVQDLRSGDQSEEELRASADGLDLEQWVGQELDRDQALLTAWGLFG